MSNTDDLNAITAEMVEIAETPDAGSSSAGETGDASGADVVSSSSGTSEQDQQIATIAAALSVTTDQADCAPGSTAEFTVEGATVGGTVTFQVTDWASDPGVDGIANSYTFQAVDGGEGDLDSVADGKFVAQWHVPSDGSATKATLDLVVTDNATGATASTTFTDALVPPSTFGSTALLDEVGDVTAPISGAIFEGSTVNGTGAGNFIAFLEINKKGSEQGYNTDGDYVLGGTQNFQYDQGGGHTDAIKLSDVPTVLFNGTVYREFFLDLSEGGGENNNNGFISLDKLQITKMPLEC